MHPVAGKCGVFAETDINGLQKGGVPPDELMASLFEAIVQQNLAVLTRGNTLRPQVLLLGGPNTYIRGMRECWQESIPKVWEERKVQLPEGVDPKSLIVVPENAQFYAALGSIEFGKDEDESVGVYRGMENLEWYMNVGRLEEKTEKVAATASARQIKSSLTSPKRATSPRSSYRRRSSQDKSSNASWASTAALHRRKPSSLIKTKISLVKCY